MELEDTAWSAIPPIVKQAITTLLNEDNRARQWGDQMIIIGPGHDGRVKPDGIRLRVFTRAPGSRSVFYEVKFGASIVVQQSALSILTAATEGRITLPRLWRSAMAMKWGRDDWFGLIPEIGYGMGSMD